MRRFRLLSLLALISCALHHADMGSARTLAADVDFANDIQTILARKCYACHGPDQQESGLRFDDRKSLLADADSGFPAILPGNGADSELVRRVTSEDEGERMPPEGKPLSAAEVELLTRWIDGGADYTVHWAFQPITLPAIPLVDNARWCENPIDNFIAEGLEDAGLMPVESAGPYELIRRVYLDVVGLPPRRRLSPGWQETGTMQLMQNWSINCWPIQASVNAGLGLGWTSCATRRPIVSSAMASSRTRGSIAIMSFVR